MSWKDILKVDSNTEKEVRDAFYPVSEGKNPQGDCFSCGTTENVLETDKILTGGKRHRLCQKCLDERLKQIKERRE